MKERMGKEFKNCWEMQKCEREKGGAKVPELGECIASKEGLGHSCWNIAGTLCGGVVQGTVAQKEENCTACAIYKLYNRLTGIYGNDIRKEFPDEEKKYISILDKILTARRKPIA